MRNHLILILSLCLLGGCVTHLADPIPTLQSANDMLTQATTFLQKKPADVPTALTLIATAQKGFETGQDQSKTTIDKLTAELASANDDKALRGILLAIGSACLIGGVVCLYLASQIGLGAWIGPAGLIAGTASFAIAYFMPYGHFVGMVAAGVMVAGLIGGAVYMAVKVVKGVQTGASAASLVMAGSAPTKTLVQDIMANPLISHVLAKKRAA